jgi:hypothetical protein
VARLQGLEYGGKYVVLHNEALQFVMQQKGITARDLTDDTQVEISLASTPLLNLLKPVWFTALVNASFPVEVNNALT